MAKIVTFFRKVPGRKRRQKVVIRVTGKRAKMRAKRKAAAPATSTALTVRAPAVDRDHFPIAPGVSLSECRPWRNRLRCTVTARAPQGE